MSEGRPLGKHFIYPKTIEAVEDPSVWLVTIHRPAILQILALAKIGSSTIPLVPWANNTVKIYAIFICEIRLHG